MRSCSCMLAGVSIQAGGCDQSPLKYKSRAVHEESCRARSLSCTCCPTSSAVATLMIAVCVPQIFLADLGRANSRGSYPSEQTTASPSTQRHRTCSEEINASITSIHSWNSSFHYFGNNDNTLNTDKVHLRLDAQWLAS